MVFAFDMTEDANCNPRKQLMMLKQNSMDSVTYGTNKSNLKKNFQVACLVSNTDSKIKNPSKSTQVTIENILSEDLCDMTPSEKFWEILAEKRRVALQDAMEENERLWNEKNIYTKENDNLHKMLDEANTFVEVFKEVLNGTINDTGIDVADMSHDGELNALEED